MAIFIKTYNWFVGDYGRKFHIPNKLSQYKKPVKRGIIQAFKYFKTRNHAQGFIERKNIYNTLKSFYK